MRAALSKNNAAAVKLGKVLRIENYKDMQNS